MEHGITAPTRTRCVSVCECVCVYVQSVGIWGVFLISLFTAQMIRLDKSGIYLNLSGRLPLRLGLLSQMCDTYIRG
jgi:hypothetical protein